MRAQAPLVQNITNYVAMNVMANVMLAAGASPAMAHARGEAAEFAGLASALSINIGTLDDEWAGCMQIAAQAAVAHRKPWVLDPVAVGATALRQKVVADLLTLSPTVIRGNASEILALSGSPSQGRGADASDRVQAAEAGAFDLARRLQAVVAVTGEIDFVTDGTQSARIANGDPMMPRITALGCSLTGIVAAFCAVAPPFDASVAAIAYFGAAGEIAAQTCCGPGSFQVAFLDALYAMTGNQLDAMARITAA